MLERRAEHLERARGEALLGLGHQQLHARAVRADGAAVEELAHGAVGVMAQHLDADQRLRELDLHERVVEAPLPRRRPRHRAVQPRAQLHLARQRGGAALMTERVHGDLPAVAARR